MRKNQLFAPSNAHEILSCATLQWSCTHFGCQSEIEVYVAATDQWETIAVVSAAAGLDAEDIAEFIVKAVIDRTRTRKEYTKRSSSRF